MDPLTADQLDVASSPDGVSVTRWFALYAIGLALGVGLLAAMLYQGHWAPPGSWGDVGGAMLSMPPQAKLLAFGVYISLCCTFLPLPTGGVVAAVAMKDAAVAEGIWATTLLVAGVGSAASTVANLNDYHLFTLMLRNRRVARVRDSRTFDRARRWFGRSPFFLLTLFNVIPIPVDVVRPLATSCRYGRGPFALANFTGRFIRYGVIAYVTYSVSTWRADAGWYAVGALLAMAGILAGGRWVMRACHRKPRGPSNPQPADVSSKQ
jgi:membrane protein YqaA with SNARE-associated domain